MITSYISNSKVIIERISENVYIATYHENFDEELSYLFTLNIDNLVRVYKFFELIKSNYFIKKLEIVFKQEENQADLPF
jgi:hypothetical protein